MGVEAKREQLVAMIRAFAPSDVAAVTAISSEGLEAARWTESGYREALQWPGIVAMVCIDKGKVSGFILGRQVADEAEILNVAVTRSSRRRGEGSNLLKTAVDQFRERRVKRVYLEVRESNAVGIAFYEKHGFCKTGQRPGYYREPAEAAVLMEMNLGD
jgi:ribosomal-protein-alanine N-acetyltransferase